MKKEAYKSSALMVFCFMGFVLTPNTDLLSQDCYITALKVGEEKYNAGKYLEAIEVWKAAKACKSPNLNIKTLDDWIWKATDTDRDGKVNGKDECPTAYSQTTDGCPTPVLTQKPKNMLLIRGGTFQMGEGLQDDEKPLHQVTVSDFYLCKYEVTVGEFKQFIDATQYRTEADVRGGCEVWNGQRWEITQGINWRYDPKGKLRPSSEYNHPVVFVSWNDAHEYCKWLSKITGKKFRLPTEAEWEYAAGNGSQHPKYSWGNDEPLNRRLGNFADETFEAVIPNREIIKGLRDGFSFTSPVGLFEPNFWGIYDLAGNVWEWCSDWYDKYPSNPVQNPKGPLTEPSNGSKVIRGGSYDNVWFNLRIADRHIEPPIKKAPSLGFRVAYSN